SWDREGSRRARVGVNARVGVSTRAGVFSAHTGRMLRIGSIVWGVRDVAAGVRFWTQALNYRPRNESEGDWVLLEPVSGVGVQLALQEVKAEASSRRRH